MSATAERQYAKNMILPTADLVQVFNQACGDSFGTIGMVDVQEILAQIVCVLLDDDERTEEGLRKLPDVERLIYFNRIDKDLLGTRYSAQFAHFRSAVHTLAYALRDRLVEYGAYSSGEFPYFLDRMLGYDIVLSHLPY